MLSNSVSACSARTSFPTEAWTANHSTRRAQRITLLYALIDNSVVSRSVPGELADTLVGQPERAARVAQAHTGLPERLHGPGLFIESRLLRLPRLLPQCVCLP